MVAPAATRHVQASRFAVNDRTARVLRQSTFDRLTVQSEPAGADPMTQPKLPMCLVLVATWVVAAAGAELQVGTGRRVITPAPLLPVSGGFGPTVPVREKRGELMARAVVFQRGDVTVAVVSLDLLGFPAVLGD